VLTKPGIGKYVGSFMNDKEHGKGNFVDINGVEYACEWGDGKKTGD